MKQRLLVLMVALTGCTALMSPTPITRSTMVAESPDAAYQRAAQALMRMGATNVMANPTSRMMSGTINNAAVLTVMILPAQEGSQIEVTGKLLPDKIAIGKFDEVEKYLALLQ